MSLLVRVRKVVCLFGGALVVCVTARAEPPDPALLASFKTYSTPVVGSYQGAFCNSVVRFPTGVVGYADSEETKSHTSKRSDGFTLLRGGQRMIVFYCGAPVPGLATTEAFIATLRNGKDPSIDRSSIVVHATTLAGRPATRVDYMLSDPDPLPPGKRWHMAGIVAFEKLPSGLLVQQFWTMLTTVESLANDEATLDALLTGYRPVDGDAGGSSLSKK